MLYYDELALLETIELFFLFLLCLENLLNSYFDVLASLPLPQYHLLQEELVLTERLHFCNNSLDVRYERLIIDIRRQENINRVLQV